MAPRWMVDSWKWFARARKLQQAEAPRTAGYQSFVSTVWGRQPRDLPPFTLRTAQQMLFDPAVCLGLQMRAAPVCNVEIAYKEGQDWVPGVRAESDDVAEFVKAQVHRIWMHITALLPAQTFGWSAGEVTYRLVDGRLEIDELLPAHTIDTKALVQNGRVVGTRVLNVKGKERGYVDLFFPKSWFHVFDRQPGQIYGLPVLLGAYSPWYDKWMQGGALDVRRMFMHKDAYGGTDITYPEGTTYIPDRGEVPNRDIARELVEQIVAGGVTARPAAYDESGHELWQLSRATVPTNPEHILRYPRDLDVEIWRGLGIADDVLSSESTGAWAGKRIPLAAFLNGLDIWVSAMLQDLTKQILQPLVLANFGDVRFEVQHKPLAEQGMEQQGETQGGSPGAAEQTPRIDTSRQNREQSGETSPVLSGVQINAATGVLADLREGTVPPSVATELLTSVGISPRAAQRMVEETTTTRMSLDPVEAVGRGVLSAAELVKAARQVLRMGGARAPKGGITIGGKHFVGGQFIPEEVLADATEEELADVEAGDGNAGRSVGLVSPNKEDRTLTLEEAARAIHSPRHKRMRKQFAAIDGALGMTGTYIDIIGDWVDGAENSLVIEYSQYRDFSELRYAMAWKGLVAEQKTVIAFEEVEDGPHSVFRAEIAATIPDARKALDEAGIPFRSLIDSGPGHILVVVYDDGESIPNAPEKIDSFGSRFGVNVEQIRGRGAEIGAYSGREQARQEYERIIREYERQFPDRPRFVPRSRLSRLGAFRTGHDIRKGNRPATLIGIGRRKGGGHA